MLHRASPATQLQRTLGACAASSLHPIPFQPKTPREPARPPGAVRQAQALRPEDAVARVRHDHVLARQELLRGTGFVHGSIRVSGRSQAHCFYKARSLDTLGKETLGSTRCTQMQSPTT